MATLWMKKRQIDNERRNGLNEPDTHSLSAGKTSYPRSDSYSSYNTSSTSSSSLKKSSDSMSLMTTSNHASNNKKYMTVSQKDLHGANSILGTKEGYHEMSQNECNNESTYHKNDQQYHQQPEKDEMFTNSTQQYQHQLHKPGEMYEDTQQFHQMPQGDVNCEEMYSSQQYQQIPQKESIGNEMYSQQYQEMPQKKMYGNNQHHYNHMPQKGMKNEMHSHNYEKMPQNGMNSDEMFSPQYHKVPMKSYQQEVPTYESKRKSYHARGDAYLPKVKGEKGRVDKNNQWINNNDEAKILPFSDKGDSKNSDLPTGAYYDEPVYYDPEVFKKMQTQYDGSNTTSTTSTESSLMSPPNPPPCNNPHCQCKMG